MGNSVLIPARLLKAEASEHTQGMTRYFFKMLSDEMTRVRISLHRGLPKRQIHVRIGQVDGLLLQEGTHKAEQRRMHFLLQDSPSFDDAGCRGYRAEGGSGQSRKDPVLK